MYDWSRPEPVFATGNRAQSPAHQRVRQPRCRVPPRTPQQYPVPGPCTAAHAAPGFAPADVLRPAAFARGWAPTL